MLNVYCIIVTFNAEKWINDCISTIQEDRINLKILVVDNNSSDRTILILKEKFPHILVVENEKNLGFAAANNLGCKIALEDRTDYMYLLNQDTKSYPDNIYKLILASNEIKNDKIGVISPIHLSNDSSKLDSQFESYINSISTPLFISDLILNKQKKNYQIGFVNAAAWLIKTSTINSIGGLFSSAFFHYGEDLNFIGRLKYFGYKNYLITDVFIHHCREERKGKKSKEFLNKELQINSNVKLFNINTSLKSAIFGTWKYSINELMKGNFSNSFNIFAFPIKNYKQIKKIRKSYLTNEIL